MSIGRLSTAWLARMRLAMAGRVGALDMKTIGGSEPRISYPRIERKGTGYA